MRREDRLKDEIAELEEDNDDHQEKLRKQKAEITALIAKDTESVSKLTGMKLDMMQMKMDMDKKDAAMEKKIEDMEEV